ncbi:MULTISPECIES: DUF1684 domain-containing protein [Tenacibaculum]|uniref:DUF1684 domain-containing protein n=1 Tax=Tenacibaculum TaxID=104267 RepID=UPI001F0AD42A|nr:MULTISPECIES: DUF1684 domain-containing protein [Tenacibaculum]MCH3882864.1 DUF1684 domain-containing protein [Tenacibaculum aquimarinum]MDO6600427.1 DUF1684 domain-containing protein [Tenacibaculum sp. 1_MG-2023]
MKKLSLIILISFFINACNSQNKRALIGETKYQQELNSSYKDASESPLTKRDLKNFKGLDFFPVDSSYIVIASLTPTIDAPVFEMKTTTDRRPLYKEYGVINFTVNGKDGELTVYQDQSLDRDKKYDDYLFLPFTDHTSGNESYGGGRYMDIFISDISSNNKVLLNFNNTYNPYCAYNPKYSCPITPRKNHLDLEIKAGVKAFKKH